MPRCEKSPKPSNERQIRYNKKYIDNLKNDPERYEEYKKKKNEQQRKRRQNQPSSICTKCSNKSIKQAMADKQSHKAGYNKKYIDSLKSDPERYEQYKKKKD